jgi:hypothetical protein
MCRSLAAHSINADWPSGKAFKTKAVARLPLERASLEDV